jgi:hypothetical protein
VGEVVFDKNAKGLAAVGNEASIFPDRVRTHEIDNSALFLTCLFLVNNYGMLSKLEQVDTLVQIRPVGCLEPFNFA